MASSPKRSTANLIEGAHHLYEMGAFGRALDSLLQVPSEDRKRADYLLVYGACLARSRRSEEAVAAFEELLALDPDCHEALTWMAVLKKNPQNMAEALGYAQRAVVLKPGDASGHGAVGTMYLAMRLAEPAIEAFLRGVELAPNVAPHRHNLGLAYLMAHRHGEAIAQLRQAIALAPRDPHSYLVLASTYALYGMAGQAIECLTDGLTHLPDSAALHSAAGGAFAMVRNDEVAEHHHRRALELSPESRSGFATWLLNQGRFEEANAVFEAMIADRFDPAFAYYGLMQSRKITDADAPFVERMERELQTGGHRSKGEMFLRYALGRAEESRGRYEAAMGHFNEANRLAQAIYHAGHPIDPASFAKERIEVEAKYESIRALKEDGNPTTAPIFIIGMIRSGTTLLDQIVSSHASVASGGELRFWIEETLRLVALDVHPTAKDLRDLSEEYVEYARLLSGPEPHFTDKMPLNFSYAGLIHTAMPNARFLHIRRHPVDTCLSIWTTFFGQGALFAYDKRNIVAFYREYQRAMAYWRATLPPDRLLEIDYEELIADAASVVPRVIEFCGLPWDDACLRHDQNQSAINTPSRWQARQPIYRTSVERWRRYEPWLGEFAELLEEA